MQVRGRYIYVERLGSVIYLGGAVQNADSRRQLFLPGILI